MHSIKLTKRVGADGVLHLDIPVGITDKEVEIMEDRDDLPTYPKGWIETQLGNIVNAPSLNPIGGTVAVILLGDIVHLFYETPNLCPWGHGCESN